MAEAAVQVSVTVAGGAERARVARAFTAGEGIVRVEGTGRSRRGCRSWVPLTAMRKAVAVCNSLRAMRRGVGWRRRGGGTVSWFELSHGWHLRLTAAPP
jgi:hypothetical protein